MVPRCGPAGGCSLQPSVGLGFEMVPFTTTSNPSMYPFMVSSNRVNDQPSCRGTSPELMVEALVD